MGAMPRDRAAWKDVGGSGEMWGQLIWYASSLPDDSDGPPQVLRIAAQFLQKLLALLV